MNKNYEYFANSIALKKKVFSSKRRKACFPHIFNRKRLKSRKIMQSSNQRVMRKLLKTPRFYIKKPPDHKPSLECSISIKSINNNSLVIQAPILPKYHSEGNIYRNYFNNQIQTKTLFVRHNLHNICKTIEPINKAEHNLHQERVLKRNNTSCMSVLKTPKSIKVKDFAVKVCVRPKLNKQHRNSNKRTILSDDITMPQIRALKRKLSKESEISVRCSKLIKNIDHNMKSDECLCCACPSRRYHQPSVSSNVLHVHSSTHMVGTNLRSPKHNKLVDTNDKAEVELTSDQSNIKSDTDDNSVSDEITNKEMIDTDSENTSNNENIVGENSFQEQDPSLTDGDANENDDSPENENNRRVKFDLSSNCHCHSCPYDENNKEHKTVGEDPIPFIPHFLPPPGWVPPECCIPERCRFLPKLIGLTPPLGWQPPPRLYVRHWQKNIPPKGWVPLGWKAPPGSPNPCWTPPPGWIPPPGWSPPEGSVPPPEFIPPPKWVPPDWTPPNKSKPPEWNPPPKWIPPPNWTAPNGSIPPNGYLPPPGAVAPKGYTPPDGWLPPGWTPAVGLKCKCVKWKPPKYWIAPPDWVPAKGSTPPTSWIPPPGWLPYGWLPGPGLRPSSDWKPPSGWFPPPGWRPPPGSRPPPVNIIPHGWKLKFIRPEERKILIPHIRYLQIMPRPSIIPLNYWRPPPGFIMPDDWKPGDKIPKGYPQYDGPDIEVPEYVKLPKGFPRVIKRGMTLPPGTEIPMENQKHNVKSGTRAKKRERNKRKAQGISDEMKEVETQISVSHVCICKPLNEKELMEDIRSATSCKNYLCNCRQNKENAEIEASKNIDENKKQIEVLIVKRNLKSPINLKKIEKTMAKHRKNLVQDIQKQLKATRTKPTVITK